MSGAAVTAGDLVFYGTMDGWFKAVHAETGEELWHFKVGSGIVGQPRSIAAPTASSTSPSFPGSAAGRAPSSRVGSIPATAPPRWASSMRCRTSRSIPAGAGVLYVFALP